MIDGKPYKDGNTGDESVSSSQRTGSSASSKAGLTQVFTEYSEKCSLVGVPFIRESKSGLERAVWVFLMLLSIAVMFVHLNKLFTSYFSYEKSTKVTLGFDNLRFPAVTFCNVNAMRRSQMENASADLQQLIETYNMENLHKAVKEYNPQFEQRDDYYDNDVPGSSSSNPGPAKLRSSNFFDSMPVNNTVKSPRADVKSFLQENYGDSWEGECELSSFGFVQETFKELWVAIPPNERAELGHQIQDMLIQCSFDGGECLMGNFTPILSASYGNCYTVQYDKWVSRRSGPNHGLELILFLQTDEYIPSITTQKGIQLVIHEPGTQPFPDDEGISVSAGTQTLIGLKQVQINRLGDPYGGCNTPKEFLSKYKVKYTRTTCQKICEQSMISAACKCYDEIEQQTISLLNFTKGFAPCRTETEMNCMTGIKFTFNAANASCNCNSPCSESKFEKTISSRQWPSVAFAHVIVDMICQEDGGDDCIALRSNKSEGDLKDEALREEFIRLNIYFEDLNFEQMTESPNYELVQFLSDVGGTVGLYIGLSVLGVFELFHLLASIFHFTCCSKKKSVEQFKNG